MNLDIAQSGERQNVADELARALRTRSDLDPSARAQIERIIANMERAGGNPSQDTLHALRNEIRNMYTSLTGHASESGMISGMRNTPRPGGNESIEAREAELVAIQRRSEAILAEAESATPGAARERLLAALADLQRRQTQLLLAQRPVSYTEIANHPEFTRVVRSAFQRTLSSWGRMLETEDRILALAREGYIQAQNTTGNPFGSITGQRLGMNKRDAYARILETGVIQEAHDAALKAILVPLRRAVAERAARAPAAQPAEPTAGPAPAESEALPAGNPAPQAADAAPQAGASPRPADVASIPPAPPQPGSLPAQQAIPAVPPGVQTPWWVHYPPPPWVQTGGQYIQPAPGAGPSNAPAAPRGRGPEGTHEAQHGPVGNEAERQRLHDQYDQLERQQDELTEQLTHVGDGEGKKAREIGEKLKTLRAQQKGVVRRLFGSDIYERLQASREAGTGHAAPANQSAGFQGREGQPAHAPNLSNAVQGQEGNPAQHGVEGAPIFQGTPAEHRTAVGLLSRVDAARFVAGKDGLSLAEVERYGVVRRWMRSLGDGLFRGMFAGGAVAAGVYSGVNAGIASSLSGALGAVGLATAPAWVPVMLAGALAAGVGATGWWGARRLFFDMGRTDALADAGWKASKLRSKMNQSYKRGDNPDIERKYTLINKWWKKAFRAQNLIPSLLGGVIGGTAMYDFHTGGNIRRSLAEGGRNIYNQGLPGLQRRWGGFWQWASNLFSSGTTVNPQCRPGDHGAALAHFLSPDSYNVGGDAPSTMRHPPSIDDIEDEITRSRLRAADERVRIRLSDAPVADNYVLRGDGAAQDPSLAPEPLDGEDAQRGAAMEDAINRENFRRVDAWRGDRLGPFPEDGAIPNAASPQPPQAPPVSAPEPLAPQANPDVDGPSLAPEPQPAPPQPQQAPQQVPSMTVEAPRRLLQPQDFRFEILQGGETPTVPQAFRRLLREAGFEGPVAEWFTDTVDKRTYYGIPNSKSGPSVLEMLTNQRGLTPTRIPDHASVDFARFFTDNSATNDILNRINRSDVLTATQRSEARRILDFLENSARRRI